MSGCSKNLYNNLQRLIHHTTTERELGLFSRLCIKNILYNQAIILGGLAYGKCDVNSLISNYVCTISRVD